MEVVKKSALQDADGMSATPKTQYQSVYTRRKLKTGVADISSAHGSGEKLSTSRCGRDIRVPKNSIRTSIQGIRILIDRHVAVVHFQRQHRQGRAVQSAPLRSVATAHGPAAELWDLAH